MLDSRLWRQNAISGRILAALTAFGRPEQRISHRALHATRADRRDSRDKREPRRSAPIFHRPARESSCAFEYCDDAIYQDNNDSDYWAPRPGVLICKEPFMRLRGAEMTHAGHGHAEVAEGALVVNAWWR